MGICTIQAYPTNWDLFSKILKTNLDRGFRVTGIHDAMVAMSCRHEDLVENFYIHSPSK